MLALRKEKRKQAKVSTELSLACTFFFCCLIRAELIHNTPEEDNSVEFTVVQSMIHVMMMMK